MFLYKNIFVIFFLCLVFFQKAAADTNIVFVHGLNSSSDTWSVMAGRVSGENYVDISLTATIHDDEYCWDSTRINEFKKCTMFDGGDSDAIVSSAASAKDHIFGLRKGQFDVDSIKWKFFKNGNYLSTEDEKKVFNEKRVFSINFSDNNDLSFDAQGAQLKAMIDDISLITNVNNFILVGHSMGGLAIRAYIQNEEIKNINTIITIDTPHLGGLFAGIFDFAGNAGTNLYEESKAMKKLNDTNNIDDKYDNIKVVYIGYSDNAKLEMGEKYLFYYPNGSLNGDGSVDVPSQMGLDVSDEIYRIIFSPSIFRNGVITSNNSYQKNDGSYEKVNSSIYMDDNYITHPLGLRSAHVKVLSSDRYISTIQRIFELGSLKFDHYIDNDFLALGFFDVPKNAWYKNGLLALVKDSIITGVNPHSIKPDVSTNRVDALSMIKRADFLHGKKKTFPTPPFYTAYYNDISSAEWYVSEGTIAYTRLYYKKNIVPFWDGNLNPSMAITRGEVAHILAEIKDLSTLNISQENDFPDLDTDHPHYAWIMACINEGIFKGDENGKFRPNAPINRAELATVLHNIFY